jgi:hypothetical protein
LTPYIVFERPPAAILKLNLHTKALEERRRERGSKQQGNKKMLLLYPIFPYA